MAQVIPELSTETARYSAIIRIHSPSQSTEKSVQVAPNFRCDSRFHHEISLPQHLFLTPGFLLLLTWPMQTLLFLIAARPGNTPNPAFLGARQQLTAEKPGLTHQAMATSPLGAHQCPLKVWSLCARHNNQRSISVRHSRSGIGTGGRCSGRSIRACSKGSAEEPHPEE